MHITHKINIDCLNMEVLDCHQRCMAGFGHGPDFKLQADAPDDIVNGSVTISHNTPPGEHNIVIELYDQDEAPNDQHDTTFKKADPMPTEEELIQRLATYLEDN